MGAEFCLHLLRLSYQIFIIQFVNVVYHIDWFANIEYSLHPRIKPTWSWCMIFSICCWILFASILLRIFASMFISVLAYSFLFLWHLCLILVLEWRWPHRMSLEVYLPLQFSGRVWVGSVQFSHSVMYNSLWPHELQHARPPCPSPTPRVYSNSCPSSRWCHPASDAIQSSHPLSSPSPPALDPP